MVPGVITVQMVVACLANDRSHTLQVAWGDPQALETTAATLEALGWALGPGGWRCPNHAPHRPIKTPPKKARAKPRKWSSHDPRYDGAADMGTPLYPWYWDDYDDRS